MSPNYVFNNLVNGAKNPTPSCVFLNRNIRKFCQSSYNTAGNVALTAYGTGFQHGNVGAGFKMMKRTKPTPNSSSNSNSKISCSETTNASTNYMPCYTCTININAEEESTFNWCTGGE